MKFKGTIHCVPYENSPWFDLEWSRIDLDVGGA